MIRASRSWARVVAGVALGLLALDSAATAADLPVKAPVRSVIYDWTGFYFGGHFGYGGGDSAPPPIPFRGKAGCCRTA